MKHAKMVKQWLEETTVNEDGEILQENKKVTYSVAREPNFVKLYLDDLGRLKNLRKSHISVLYSLLKFMNYADDKNAPQVVVVNSYIKKQILLESPDIRSTQTIADAISALKKAGILISVDRTAYRVNPDIIGKGEWRDILELRMNITYNITGRHIDIETEHADSESEDSQTSETAFAEETEIKKSA